VALAAPQVPPQVEVEKRSYPEAALALSGARVEKVAVGTVIPDHSSALVREVKAEPTPEAEVSSQVPSDLKTLRYVGEILVVARGEALACPKAEKDRAEAAA